MTVLLLVATDGTSSGLLGKVVGLIAVGVGSAGGVSHHTRRIPVRPRLATQAARIIAFLVIIQRID
jgi:hypothetical protein